MGTLSSADYEMITMNTTNISITSTVLLIQGKNPDVQSTELALLNCGSGRAWAIKHGTKSLYFAHFLCATWRSAGNRRAAIYKHKCRGVLQ